MTSEAQFRDTLKTLLAALGSPEPTRRRKARQTIRDTLAANQKSWNDLLASLWFRGQHGEKLKKLFAMLGQDNNGEFDNARQKISDLLATERRTWKTETAADRRNEGAFAAGDVFTGERIAPPKLARCAAQPHGDSITIIMRPLSESVLN